MVEKPEFQRAERHAMAGHGYAMGRGIDHNVAALQLQALKDGGFIPAQQCTHASDHFTRAERLCDVIVGAEFQADHTVGFLTPRGQYEDRSSCKPLVTLK